MQPPSTLEDHVTGEFDIEALVGLAGERAAEEHLPRVDCRVSPLSRTTMQPNNRSVAAGTGAPPRDARSARCYRTRRLFSSDRSLILMV